MDMETLVNVSGILFRISIGVFLLGLTMVIFSYWKMNIREVYLIRSGKAKRRTIEQLEAINMETGRLKENIDLDYTTDGLRKNSKRLGRNTEKTEETGSLFKRNKHSGNTGKFSTSLPTPIRDNSGKSGEVSGKKEKDPPQVVATETTLLAEKSAQKEKVSEQMRASVSNEAAQEAPEKTIHLDDAPLTTTDYSDWISTAYQTGVTEELGKPAPAEPMVPIRIISRELIIHTDEFIEIG